MHGVDHLEQPFVLYGVFLRDPVRIAALGHTVIAADTQGAGVAAGVAPDAAVHLRQPEGEALLLGFGLEGGHVLIGVFGLFAYRFAHEHVRKKRCVIPAAAALGGGHVLEVQYMHPAVGRDLHFAGLHVHRLHIVQGAHGAPDLAKGHHAFAGHGEDHDVFAVHEFFLQQFDDGAAVAALDRHADLFAFEARQVHGGIVNAKRAPDQPVHILFGAHEQGGRPQRIKPPLPADHHVQIGKALFDLRLQFFQHRHILSVWTAPLHGESQIFRVFKK